MIQPAAPLSSLGESAQNCRSGGDGACGHATPVWPASILLGLVVLGAGYLFFETTLPLKGAIQLGGDEGLELAKTMLYKDGYALYNEIWNDQPPLHTYLVSVAVSQVWHSVAAARALTVIFGAVLSIAVFVSSRVVGGALAALFGTGFLILSPGFAELSASCMLEVPALAPAVLALAMLIRSAESKFRLGAAGAGVLFGMALLTKLVPVMLVPVAALTVYLQVLRRRSCSRGTNGSIVANTSSMLACWKAVVAAIVVFAVGMVVTFVGLDLLIERGAFIYHFQQTWASHFGATKSFEYGSAADYPFDWTVPLKHWDATLPAVVGVFVCFRAVRKDPMYLLPPLWLAWSLLVFGLHRPWWSYYYVHTAIPLCWCAGVGLAFFWRKADLAGLRLRFRMFRPVLASFSTLVAPTLLALYLLSAAFWAGGRAYMQVRIARNSPQIYNSLVLAEMARYKPFTKWLYTDEPIYSFHSGIPLPPDLAVVMLKRFWSGEMTNERLAREVKEYAPGLILLGTQVPRTPLDELIHSDYRLVYFDNDHRLYAHKSISNKPPL